MASPTDSTRRTTLACNHCRLKRQKCDGNKSGCSQCAALRVFCTFPDAKKRGPVKGYIDVLEGRLYELESALLQVLPLVTDAQLDEVTASIPPTPSRPHFRARFNQSSGGGGSDASSSSSSSPQNLVVPGSTAAASPSEIVFRHAQYHHHHPQPRREGKPQHHRHQHQHQHRHRHRYRQSSSQIITATAAERRSCSLRHNRHDLKQMVSSPWQLQPQPQQQQQEEDHHNHFLPPLELGLFNDSPWPPPPPPPLLIAGEAESLSRPDHPLFLDSPAKPSFGGGGGGESSEFDFLRDFDRSTTTDTSTSTSTSTSHVRETIMVSARGF